MLYADELESHLSELAYHTCKGGEWEKAHEYARRAGERALALYAPHAAAEQFTQAINAAHHLQVAVTAAIYRSRASAFETLGDFERARSDLETAAQLAHERGATADEWAALLALGLLWAGRDYARAGDYYQRALTLIDALDEPLKRARTLNRLANWHLNVDEPLKAKTYHREALAIFETAGDVSGTARTCDLLCMAYMLSNKMDDAVSYGERAVDMLRALDDRQPLSSSLITLPFASALRQSQTMALTPMTLAQATSHTEEGLRIAREMGWRAGEASALWVHGLCVCASGDLGRGLASATTSLALAEDIGHHQWMAAARYTLGEVTYELYALALAREHLEHGLTLARTTGSWHWIRLLTGLLASTCIAQGDLAMAESALDAGASTDIAMQTVGQRLAWAARGELKLAQGDPVAALTIADRLACDASDDEQRRMPFIATLRANALLALGRHDEAAMWLATAEETLRAHGARTMLRRVLTNEATLALRMGRADDGARYAGEARSLTYQMAETIPDAVLRAVFMRQALASLPSATQHAGEAPVAASTMLTAREREVAVLVAQGKSNRAIAAELVISERTTESHVTNILGKLGFTSRAQIAAWAANIGLAQTLVHSGAAPRQQARRASAFHHR
jgi:DNA-binding NarL/FixJ family response regulator